MCRQFAAPVPAVRGLAVSVSSYETTDPGSILGVAIFPPAISRPIVSRNALLK